MNTPTGWTFTTGQFSASWIVRSGDFDGDGNVDLLMYNDSSGQWFQVYADGGGQWRESLAGSWSPGWDVLVTSFDGNSRTDVLLYNRVTGAYFQGINTDPAEFEYVGGMWGVGQTVVATSPGG